MKNLVNLSVESCSAWTSDPRLSEASDTPPDAAGVPPMIRRRLSSLSKIALSIALECVEGQSVEYSIFCSRHGELQRTTGLLQELAQGNELSPAAFSQSVHNSAAGLFSIILDCPSTSTSISAGADTFGYGLVEAATHLMLNPGEKVLLVAFDEPPPDIFGTASPDPAYGVAFLFSDADGFPSLQLRLQPAADPTEATEPLALTFLRFWRSGSTAGKAPTNRMIWEWKRHDSRH